MKRYISYCTFVFAILFASCNNAVEGLDPAEALFVSTDDMEMESIGGEQTIKVNSYCSWQIESTENWQWITASKTKGSKGNSDIKFVLSENRTVENRTAVISILNTKYNLKHDITVLQKEGKPYLATSKDSMGTTANGVSDTITVESNVDYTITSSQEWCKVKPVKSEAGVKKINVDIEPNATTSERTAVITFKNSEFDITKEIAVSQEKFEPYIEVSDTNIAMAVEGGSKSITLEANINWSATCDAGWVSLSSVNGNQGTSTVTVTIDNNAGIVERDTKIVISNSEYNITKEITVSQAKFEPSIEVSDNSIEMPVAGGSKELTFESNINWNATCDASWVRLSRVNGESGTYTITATIENNTGTNARNVKILISNSEYKITKEIAVSQAKFEPSIEVSDNSIEMPVAGGSKEFTLASNIDWSATCDASWVRLSRVNGESGTYTITATIENNTGTNARNANIVITNSKYNITKEMTVAQSAFDAILDISSTSISANGNGETKEVAVSSTIDWIASCNAEWITLSPVNGSKGNTTMGVTVASNENATSRTDSIIVSNNQYNIARTIIVNQAAFAPVLSSVVGTSFTINYLSGSKIININANVEYTVSCDADWLSVEKVQNGINLKYTTNRDGSSNRTATVTVSSVDYEDVSIELSITQQGFSSNNVISYTSTGSILSPNVQTGFGANIIGLRAENGVGEIVFDAEVTSIPSAAFNNCGQLTSITIPSTVTTIGENAFKNCSALESVDLPSGITTIGSAAFSSCTALTDVTLPEDLTSISSNLFYGCSSLSSVDMPSSITSIGSYAFYNCGALENVEIPEDVSTIDSYAFSGCTALESIEIPAGVSTIGSYAFSGCTALESIGIAEGLSSIDSYAFSGCTALKGIEMPEGVSSIGSYAFSGCTALENIEIAEGLSSIGSYAFSGCTALESIEMPEGVSSIGSYAFSGCIALESIEIPEGVAAVNERLFNECTSLKNVELPSTVTNVGSYAFYNCSALESIDIPLEVTSIGQYAFYNCNKIKIVCIPSKVTSIGQYAFYNCSSLSVVICTGKTPASGGSNMFSNNANGRNIFVPVGCSSTYKSYSYWSNYSSSIYDIEYTATECTSLSIVAEDVDANATYTTITYTAITNGSTPYGYVSNIEMTGRVQSASFPQNTGEEDIVREISYTYMGQTATTTITQAAPIRKSYTVDLNYNDWRKSTSVSNPDPSLYDGVYESNYNWHVNGSTATMYIDINGYDEFSIYVRSYGESGCDYVTVSNLDSSTVKASASYSNSGTSIGSYTKVTYSNIGGGSHRITIKYRKDYSVHSGNDRGYLLIPKNQ